MNIKWNWRRLFLESADSITAKGRQSGGSVLVRSFVCMVFAVLVLKFLACFFFSLWPPLLAGAYMVLTLWGCWLMSRISDNQAWIFVHFRRHQIPVTEKRLGENPMYIHPNTQQMWLSCFGAHSPTYTWQNLVLDQTYWSQKLAGFRSGFQNHIQT